MAGYDRDRDEEAGVDVSGARRSRSWWRDAVMYEVYPRSFADANGDGDGDLAGLRARLPYLADLGVDGIWLAPWFPSPMADGGYDVSDYRSIHPMFGTLDDGDALIREAHEHGLRVIVDMVANHTSDEHPWFRSALAAAPGSPQRDRYFFRDGRGERGELPPNNWISAFGGPAWSRTTGPDGTPGQWYLHLFAPQQPDLNWSNEAVLTDFESILRFWFDRGVDGVRVDAAPALAKAPGLPDADYGGDLRFVTAQWVGNPHWDVDSVHEVMRRWRAVGDEYPDERVFVAEAVVNGPERLSRYLRPDEMHTAFNFPFLKAAWDGGLRKIIDETLATHARVQAPATWAVGSHDETRIATRYGRERTGAMFVSDDAGAPSDLALGRRRSRAVLLLILALPGGVYIYQGDELGLPEVEDIPESLLQDPMWERTGHAVRGRDGCRVPMPWAGVAPPYGFSDGGRPWLPMPADWAELCVEAQLSDPASTLACYRDALRLRRATPAFHTDAFTWRESPDGVIDFDRGSGLRCVVNVTGDDVRLDVVAPDARILLASSPLTGRVLPRDTAVWLTT
jgi:alpha-glucosidase